MRIFLFFIGILIPRVFAWGNVGHETTAYFAYNLLTDKTRQYLAENYNLTTREKFIEISTWADTIKKHHEYGWSYQLHYVNVLADPPNNCPSSSFNTNHKLEINRCILNYTLDCPDNRCVIGAVYNYSQRYLSNIGKNDYDGLRFLVHFMGDIFQPFHASYQSDLGGNTIKIIYNGATTNLHSLWDSELLDTYIYDLGGIYNYYGNMTEYAKTVLPDIENNPKEFAQSGLSTICNKYLYCDIFGRIENGTIISREYYKHNIDIIKKRLAMSGFFMATILNKINT